MPSRSFLTLAFLGGIGCVAVAAVFAHSWWVMLAAFGGYLMGFAVWSSYD